MPFKFNGSRWDKFSKAKYRVTNCAEYNEALRQRGDVTVWFGEDAVRGWWAGTVNLTTIFVSHSGL
jgi:hypothetical protein